MQLNVFVTQKHHEALKQLLVLPFSPHATIPPQYQDSWNYYATVNSGDSIFGDINARAIEIEVERSGHAVVTPSVPDRR